MNIEQRRANEAKRGLEWLDDHWPRDRRQCPICGNANWQIDTLSELRSFNGGDMVIGGPSGGILPIMSVMCDRCGFLHLFNALKTRAIDMSEYTKDEGAQ